MRKLERTLKALADGNRLRILNILLQGELCVCDLRSVLALPQPLLSRHLAYLRNAGVVRDRREGSRVFYSLALDDEVGEAVGQFLQTVFPLFETLRLDAANRQEIITCCSPPAAPDRKTNRPTGRRPKEEAGYGNQSSPVQL